MFGEQQFWTSERVNRLEELRAVKMSFAEIADAMGLTKGQIAGKVHRLIEAERRVGDRRQQVA